MNRWYLSGGMSNVPNYREEFERGAEWLRLCGYSVVNPCDVGILLQSGAFEYDEIMSLDFKLIEMCDGIYMLNGWEKSRGARAELSYAKALGKKVKFESKQWGLRNAVNSANETVLFATEDEEKKMKNNIL